MATTFHARFDEHAARTPDAPALTFLGAGDDDVTSLGYAALRRRARAVAAAVAAHARPGDRALVLVEPSAGFFEAFLGCLYAGAVAVPLYPPEPARLERALPRLAAVIRDAAPAVVVLSPLVAAALPCWPEAAALVDGIPCVVVDDAARGAELAADVAADGDTLAFLQYTSGSTAEPKGVMVSHANLLHNTGYLARALGAESFQCVVGWAPPYHDMGLVGTVLSAWAVGGHAVQMAPATFLAAPARWLQAIDRWSAASTFAPPFALDFTLRKVPPAERSRFALDGLRVLGIGGEPVDPDAVDRFAAAFAPAGLRREAVLPGYGLAEHTVWVMCSPPRGPFGVGFVRATLQSGGAEPAAADVDPAAVTLLSRYALDGGEVEAVVVDPERAQPAADGTVGELWLQSPSVARGYWNRPALSQRTFAARLPGRAGTFLRTGDLAFRRGGELFLAGRAKDLLIVRGVKHAPHDLERSAAAAHPAVRRGRCAAFAGEAAGEVVLAVEVTNVDERAAVSAAIREQVARAHGVHLADVVVLPAGGLARTSNGKLSRAGCRADYLATRGREHEPARAAADVTPGALDGALEETLRRSMAELLRCAVDDIDPRRPLAAFALDSMMVAQLCTLADERFGVRVPPSAFAATQTLRGLCAAATRPAAAVEPVAPVAPAATLEPAKACPSRPRGDGGARMAFSLAYFPAGNLDQAERFSLMLRTAQVADRRGFDALWIPERHFHPFGGSCPNPAVLAAAFAATTERVRLRAGSVVLPLHHPVRVAEEWAVVDQLSRGRVDLAFASGWNANDFVLAPDAFATRRETTLAGIETVQRLWRGDALTLRNGAGVDTRVHIEPRPLQPELTAWYTCTRGVEGFLAAGGHGHHVLTGLLFQSLDDLAARIALYRQARERHGHDPGAGRVTLMLHTFVGDSAAEVRERVRAPLAAYLASSVDLWQQESAALRGRSPAEQAALIEFAVERYQQHSSLIGTPQTCARFVERAAAIGVDEIACLVDFGLPSDVVLAGLDPLDRIRSHFSGPPLATALADAA